MRRSTIGHRVQILKQKFRHSLSLPFREVLPERLFEEALTAEAQPYRNRLFSPQVTVWPFCRRFWTKITLVPMPSVG